MSRDRRRLPRAADRAGVDHVRRSRARPRRLPAVGRRPGLRTRGGVARGLILRLGAAIGVGLVVGGAIVAGMRLSSDAAGPEMREPVAVRAWLSAPAVLFGDPLRADVHVLVDRTRVDPASVRLVGGFEPFRLRSRTRHPHRLGDDDLAPLPARAALPRARVPAEAGAAEAGPVRARVRPLRAERAPCARLGRGGGGVAALRGRPCPAGAAPRRRAAAGADVLRLADRDRGAAPRRRGAPRAGGARDHRPRGAAGRAPAARARPVRRALAGRPRARAPRAGANPGRAA